MGHNASKTLYRNLGKKIDNLTMRAPWNETFFDILKELYTPDDADLLIKMPYSLSSLQRIGKATKYDQTKLQKILKNLSFKGLVIDFWINDEYLYMPSPMVIGIFEFTMMRTGSDLNTKTWAKLFHRYMQEDSGFYTANFQKGEKISFMRTLPHEETIDMSDYVEILDYESAIAITEASDKFSNGICSCRHEKYHIDEKECDVPLDGCSSYGAGADYLIRNNLAKEVSKSEMLEHIARSKDLGLVLNADNVQKNITFICHCCKCCCGALMGISRHGFANSVITSSYIAQVDEILCTGCGKCAQVCPIDAIEMIPHNNPENKGKNISRIDTAICLGCGVCALKCSSGAVKLKKRKKRVIPPETTFERIILQCLERGTLQNQIFDQPQSLTHQFMRGFIGGFLKLTPVKKALMSDTLRSGFLTSLKTGIKLQGKGYLTEM